MGRPKKQNVVRDRTTGRSRGGLRLEIMSVALRQRAKEFGIPDPIEVEKQPDGSNKWFINRSPAVDDIAVFDDKTGNFVGSSPLAGYCLGRLLLAGRQRDPAGITEPQFNAGLDYAKLCRRYDSLVTGRARDLRGANFDTGGGASLRADPDPDMIKGLRDKYVACYDALIKEGMVPDHKGHCEGVLVAVHTYDTCLDRVLYGALIRNPRMLGNMRAGLNVLSRVLR